MIDTVALLDGTKYSESIGGIPMFGWAGMRPWVRAEDIVFLARVGRDFDSVYGKWMHDNGVSYDAIQYVADECPRCVMYLDENMDWISDRLELSVGAYENTDPFRPTLDDLKSVIDKDTRGMYICGPQDDAPTLPAVMWDGFFEYKDSMDFKVMWEANGSHIYRRDGESIDRMFDKIEMLSFNLPESKVIFGFEEEREVLDYLRSKKNCELILLRCGARGMYTISRGEAWFIPSVPVPEGESVVDTTGCGNTATSAAMAAWCEGCDLVMTGIRASISANYNLRQNGPVPLFTDELMAEAAELADRLYKANNYYKI